MASMAQAKIEDSVQECFANHRKLEGVIGEQTTRSSSINYRLSSLILPDLCRSNWPSRVSPTFLIDLKTSLAKLVQIQFGGETLSTL